MNAQTEDATTTEPTSVTSYRVSWAEKGNDQSHTDTCLVDSDDMTRPGDREQRNDLLRRMLAIRHLPVGRTVPDNIVLQDVNPMCNCAPFPGAECAYAEFRGERFFLRSSSSQMGCEVITDRHDGRMLAIASTTLSVEILTMIREKYEHQ